MKQKEKSNQSSNKNGFGFFSMLSMIIGIVVGSGIFFVNDSLYATTKTIGLSIISWIAISVIIFFMLISFIEVTSSTKIKNQPGTVKNWYVLLWGKNVAKYIGVFFTFIYLPIIISGMATLSSDQLIQLLNEVGVDVQMGSLPIQWSKYIIITISGLVFLLIFFLFNTFTKKPGDIFQKTGTVLKFVPLLLLILFGFIAIFANLGGVDSNNIGDMFKPETEFNDGWKLSDSFGSFKVILLMSPTIMFSFDGFLFAATLQGESRKPSTYKISLIFGMLFVIFIYIFVSFFSFAYGDAENGFSIPSALKNIFGAKTSSWLIPIIYGFILLSVLTSLSGLTNIINRNVSDMSSTNVISDVNGNLIRRNRVGVPQNSSIFSMAFTILIYLIISIFNAIFIFTQGQGIYAKPDNQISTIVMTGNSLNLDTLFVFTIYTFLIIGALKNRYTKEVEVEKNKAFIPSGIITTICMFVILVIFSISLFNFDYDKSIGNLNYVFNFSMMITYTFVVFISTILITMFLNYRVKKTSEEDFEKKQIIINAYNEQKVDPKYLNSKKN